MRTLAHYCIEHGYSGYEGFVDLPGTVAGAVVNNSGCYGCSVERVLRGIDIVTPDGLSHLGLSDMQYSFRNSAIKQGLVRGVITRVYFDKGNIESTDELKKRADKFHKQRILTQDPPAKNLGTTVNLPCDVRGFRGMLIKIFRRIMIYLRQPSLYNKIMPGLVCFLYLKPSVAKYISKKYLNCFIWRDEGADNAFQKYMYILKKLYGSVSTEIQIFE